MTDESRTENPGDAPVQAPAAAGPHGTENLSDLIREGATLEDLAAKPPAGAAAPAAVAAPADEVDEPPTVEDVVDMLTGVRDMVAPMVEETGLLTEADVERIWSDKALKKIAKPLVKLMLRHGMGFEDAFDKFGPWAMMLAGVAAPAFATWKLIRSRTPAPVAATTTTEVKPDAAAQ